MNAADNMIQSIYSYHLHHNDSVHLDGGVAKNSVYYIYWKLIVNLPARF